jgi:ArsR family transcriptional regulator, arsenate/arsenite/antimonite-responsive transcriptional repressor
MYAKVENFTIEQQEIARFSKLLAHPARVAILQYLAKEDRCISGDISNELPLSRTTVSQHLQELRNNDLIKGEINGQTICYCINWKTYDRLQKLYGKFFSRMTDHKNQCC